MTSGRSESGRFWLVALAVLFVSIENRLHFSGGGRGGGVNASVFNTDICASCKPVEMPNFNLTRSLGTWYYYAQSPNFKNCTDPSCLNFGCFKQTITLKDSCTLIVQDSYVDILGQIITDTNERYFDAVRPNVWAQYLDLSVKDAYGRQATQNTRVEETLIYTDYDCVKVGYACTTLNNFWFSKPYRYFYVAVRNKEFDSINTLLPALNYLKTAGLTTNDLQFLALSAQCPN